MPKKKKRLPYRRIRVRIRGTKRYRYAYYSNLTKHFVSKGDISKNPRTQGFREAFPRRSEKTRRRIRYTLFTFRRVGFNPIEKSPNLKRYFQFLREKHPRLYNLVYNQVAGDLKKEGSVNVGSIHENAIARYSRPKTAGKKKATKRKRRSPIDPTSFI